MHIALDGSSAPAPQPEPMLPAPTPEQVGRAQAALRARLPADAASQDAPHYEAALQEAIRAQLVEQTFLPEAQREAQRLAEEEALRRAAILLQAHADVQRGAKPAQMGVDPLQQSASELGVALGSDAAFAKPALDASVSALQRPDVVHPDDEIKHRVPPRPFQWAAATPGPVELPAHVAFDHPATLIPGRPDQTQLTLQQAHDALDDASRAGLTMPEALTCTRAQLGGTAKTEVLLAEAALAHVGDTLAPDARADRLAQAAHELGPQFDAKVLVQAQAALRVQLDAASPRPASVTATRAAWRQLQQDRAAPTPASLLASDEATYHAALLHELDDAAGERSPQWRTEPLQNVSQIDRRWQAEQRVLQLNGADDAGTAGSPTPQALQQSLHAAEIVATVQAAGVGPGLTTDGAQAHELDKQLTGAGSSLTREVEDDSAIRQIEQRAAQDIEQAGAAQSHAQASLVKEGEALQAFDRTRWEATLTTEVLQAPQTRQAIDRLHAPASLQEAAALASALHDASPALAQAAFARNAALRARVEQLIAQGPAPVGVRAGRALQERGEASDTYFGPIGQLAGALGGVDSTAGREVLSALARRAPDGGTLAHETLDAPRSAYQTLIDAAPHTALARALEAHTGLTPASDQPRRAPEDSRSAARAELALDDASNGTRLNAKTLPEAFRKAQQQNPTLSTASLVEGTEVALIDSGTTTSAAQGAQLISAAQLVDDVTLKQASANVQEDRLQPASGGASLSETPASRVETGSSAASPVEYLRSLLGHNVSVPEALAATRVWLGGDVRREPELMQAALEALGEHLAAQPLEGDPAQLALAQLRDGFTPSEQTQLSQLAARMAQDAPPDTAALGRAAQESVAAHQRWRQDQQRNADASRLQADQQACLDSVRAGLDAAAGHPGTGWQADEQNWERLGKAQEAFAEAYVQAAAAQTGSATGAQQDVADVQEALEAVQVLAQIEAAKAHGGASEAARTLTEALRGVAPTTRLSRDLLGDGTRAQPGSQAVVALRLEAARAILAPLDATRRARDAQDAQTALRLAGRQLDQYRGTVLYAPLVDDIVDAQDTQRTFEQIKQAVQAQRDGAARQHALVEATNGLNRELAQALYHKAFADPHAEPAWAAAGAAPDASVLYDRLGPSDPDMIALLHDLKGAGESGRFGKLEVIGAPSKASMELGKQNTVIGFGFDHMPQGTPMQLAHDLVALGGQVGTEVSRETGIEKDDSLARAAQPDAKGNLVGPPDAQTQVSVNTQAALLNALGRAEHLQPVRVATSLEQEQQIRNGTLALYSEGQVVYSHSGRRTTLGELTRSLMAAEGVRELSDATPMTFDEQQMTWWDARAAGRDGSVPTFTGALLAGANAAGQTFVIGPAAPQARASYAQWQHHSGLADGMLIAAPYKVYGANGQVLSDARYTVQHATGDNPWYSRRNLEADAQVAMTVGAVAFSVLAAPEAAPLWAEFGAMALDAAFAATSVPQGLNDLIKHGPNHLQGWAELTGGLSGGTLAWLNGVRIAARLAGSSQRFAEQLDELARLSGQATARAITPYAGTERLGRWLDGDAALAQSTRAGLMRMQRGAQRVSGPVMADVRGTLRVNRLALTNRATGMTAGALNTTTLGEQSVQMMRQGDADVRDWVQLLSSVAGLGLGAITAQQNKSGGRGDSTDEHADNGTGKRDGSKREMPRDETPIELAVLDDLAPPPDANAVARARAALRAGTATESDYTVLIDDACHQFEHRVFAPDVFELRIQALLENSSSDTHDIDVREVINQAKLIGLALLRSYKSEPTPSRTTADESALEVIIHARQASHERGQNPILRDADHYLSNLMQEWQETLAIRLVDRIVAITHPESDHSMARTVRLADKVSAWLNAHRLLLARFSGLVTHGYDLGKALQRASAKAAQALQTRLENAPASVSSSKQSEADGLRIRRLMWRIEQALQIRLAAAEKALGQWLNTSSMPASSPGGTDWASLGTRHFIKAFNDEPDTTRIVLETPSSRAKRGARATFAIYAKPSSRSQTKADESHVSGKSNEGARAQRSRDSARLAQVVVAPDNRTVTLTFGGDNRQVVATVLGRPGRIPENANEFVDRFEVYPTGGRNGLPVVIARIKGSAPDHSVFVLPEPAGTPGKPGAAGKRAFDTPTWTHFRKRLTGSVGNVALTAVLAPIVAPISLLALAGGVAALLAERMVGNPFFKQERIGRKGKPFTMYKLHTMPGPGESNPSDGASDDRATPVGRKLRKLIIDEMLVLWTNLLKGQMQLFAYRPQVAAERELMRHVLSPTDYAVWESVTAQHRPGFLSAHGNMSVFLTPKTPENMRARAVLDVWQAQNTGFRLGLRILADTIRIGLRKVNDISELAGYKETDGGTRYVLPGHTRTNAGRRAKPQ